MNEKQVEELTKRLDAIIAILAAALPKPETVPSIRDQIQLLDRAGLGPTHIGRIVGKKAADVGSELAKLKNKKKRKNGNK